MGDTPALGELFDPFNGIWQQQVDELSETKKPIVGTKQPVQILYDSMLIPHVYANNEQDLFWAQGYITAKHRLWQMEFQTHAAAGRISEILGAKEGVLNYDREKRRKGMVFGAKRALAKMREHTQINDYMNAYTAGVNAYITSLQKKDLPIEYKLLGYEPEPWTALKSALLLMYMADDLSGYEVDAQNNMLIQKLGKEMFDFLFPDRSPQGIDPVIPVGTKWDFEAQPMPEADTAYWRANNLTQVEATRWYTNQYKLGSNNWAISGKKSKSGKPILANDPHLKMSLPALWFVMHLKSPNINVLGATLPGALGVIIGFNEQISWGVTNAYWDVKDWYKITFKDNRRKEYLHDGKWLKTQMVLDTIRIRGAQPFIDTLIYTHHGPISYDRNFKPTNNHYNQALKWLAHELNLEQLTFIKINQANHYDDFVGALKYYSCPAQNFAFASIQGDIAFWVNGKMPLKWTEQGKFILDGNNPKHDWQGFVPATHNPHVLNPPREFVSSANQHSVAEDYPYYLYFNKVEYYRNRMINELLDSNQVFSVEDIMTMQQNSTSLKAREFIPYLLTKLDSLPPLKSKHKKIIQLLENWDYNYTKDSRAATVFDIMWNQLYASIWEQLRSEADYIPSAFHTIYLIKEFDGLSSEHQKMFPNFEKMDNLIADALQVTEDSINKLSEDALPWKKANPTLVQHLARLAPFSLDSVQVDGHPDCINAIGKQHGPSWRMVVTFDDEQAIGYGIYPGGQSGNPFSPYYSNWVTRWANGQYLPLRLYSKEEIQSQIISSATINPNAL